MQKSQNTALRQKLFIAATVMAMVYFLGTVGYFFLGDGQWSLADCAYMTVISITTVGYGEILKQMDQVPHARLFTSFLLISGGAIVLYFVSVLTTFLVEGEFLNLQRRRKMNKAIAQLQDHFIVCGAGRTGVHIVQELQATNQPFIVIENNPASIEACVNICRKDVLHIIGDATHDQVLIDAGIKRAKGVLAALPADPDNLYIIVTARGLNPNLRIVTKGVGERAVEKLGTAGANSVVSVNKIGGVRMASEMIRPNVVNFLDTMMRDKDKTLRFEELTIPTGSSLVGKPLSACDIRKERNLLIVAAITPGKKNYIYSPGPNFLLEEGMTLVLLGESDSVRRLQDSDLFSKPEIT